MNDEPKKIQSNRKYNPKNCDSHVKFIKEILNKNKHDQCVSHEVEKMIFMEHDKQLQT